MIIFNKKFPDLPGLNPNIDPKKGSEHTISVSITQEQIKEFKEKWNLDVINLTTNALRDEVYLNISKEISDLAFKKKEKPSKHIWDGPHEINWDDINNKILMLVTTYNSFHDTPKNDHTFIITNLKLAILLQKQNNFKSIEVTSVHAHGLYKIGMLEAKKDDIYSKNVDVYVNPYLEWKNNKMAIIFNKFWNWEKISISMTAEKTMAPKQVLKLKFNNKKINSDVYELINFENEL
jgi:hypothetical protein